MTAAPVRTFRHARRLRSGAGWLALALAVTACSAPGGATTGGTGGGSTGAQTRYVGGDGTVTVVAAADREPAPAVNGPTLDGGQLDLASLRGDVVVLNVWASWCSPCRAEAPILREVAASTRARGVRFVGINVRDGHEAAVAFERGFGITYPSLDASKRQDILLSFRGTLPPQAIPSTVIIDRRGRVAARVVGEVTLGKLTTLLTPLIAEPRGGGA